MGDKDKLDITDTFVPYDDHTSKTKLLRSLTALLKRDTEDPEPSEATSGIKAYPFVKPRVSWTQRVLGWFRKN